jgi:DNA-directed RNA polymerase subunit M/transcription elongation factor TFIIS
MVEFCDHCGASMKKHWHSITPGLATALVKFRLAVHNKNSNSIHLQSEINLTKNEYNNFQKLRFHALIAKTGKTGYWLLTHRGAQFLNGEMAIPERVETFRNRVVAHSEELVTIQQVYGGEKPIFEQSFDFDYATEDDLVSTMAIKNKRKGKPKCPTCGNTLIPETKTEPGSNPNSLILSKFMVCPNKTGCGFRYEVRV